MMRNIGTYEALLRISAGTFLLAWTSRQPKWNTSTTLLAAFAAVVTAEGVTGRCLLNHFLGVTSVEDEGDKELLRLGPIVYRRVVRRPARTLWGVRPEIDRDEMGYQAPTAIETNGWNWEGQTDSE